jgi:hypothetical protein
LDDKKHHNGRQHLTHEVFDLLRLFHSGGDVLVSDQLYRGMIGYTEATGQLSAVQGGFGDPEGTALQRLAFSYIEH